MGLNVPDRIHVAPVGYEVSRVVQPAYENKADIVVLINHVDNDDRGEKCFEQVQKQLDELKIEYRITECDLFNLYNSLGTIAEVIDLYPDDEVYVNVASGSKITAIAGMIASMVTDSIPYYAKASSYDGESPEYSGEVNELPQYPIDSPEEPQAATLEYISQLSEEGDYPSKGQLIQFAEANRFSIMTRNVDGKGKYRLLDTHILEPLESKGYIEIFQEGRERQIGITEKGKAANQAFRHLIRSDIDWNPQE